MPKPHLIYVGHIGGHTGLARVADNLLVRLAEDWRITVVSLNHPARYQCPYRLLTGPFAGDTLGTIVTRQVCQSDPPDVLWLYMDPGPTIEFLSRFPLQMPIIAYMPVDAEYVRDAEQLNRLAHGVFLSRFGRGQARAGGYTGPASVVGHGVDTALYHPRDRIESRHLLGLPEEAFIFGCINRNQVRKRWDILLHAYAEMWGARRDDESMLYCHCEPVHVQGWDLPRLAAWLGIQKRVSFPPAPYLGEGMPESVMPSVYSALDVQISSSQGDGFGLVHLEGMACGIPQIVPRHSALPEWCGSAVCWVPALDPVVVPGGWNLVEQAVRTSDLATAMRALQSDACWRAGFATRGLALSHGGAFDWDALAAQFATILHGARHDAVVA